MSDTPTESPATGADEDVRTLTALAERRGPAPIFRYEAEALRRVLARLSEAEAQIESLEEALSDAAEDNESYHETCNDQCDEIADLREQLAAARSERTDA
jgi:septal ring factor EnvC (AmiA/AmiB activator)